MKRVARLLCWIRGHRWHMTRPVMVTNRWADPQPTMCDNCGLTEEWRPCAPMGNVIEPHDAARDIRGKRETFMITRDIRGKAVSREDIAELRRLLKEATPGKWKLWGGEVRADIDGTANLDTSILVCVPQSKIVNGHARVFNASLIATMQRALPDLLDLAEAALERPEIEKEF